jgi:integrase
MILTRGSRCIAAVALSACLGAGCASEYTILDRSSIEVSASSRIAAGSLLPGASKYPKIEAHLGLAEEVYGKQLSLLKERRNKVRARRRALTLTSYATMLASSIGTGYVALAATDNTSPKTDLKVIGLTSLIGLGLGTGLQIGALMQEESSDVDEKIRHLQGIYDGMLDKLRTLALMPASDQIESQMAGAVETFINEALQINVKG